MAPSCRTNFTISDRETRISGAAAIYDYSHCFDSLPELTLIMERPPDQGRPTKRPKHTHQHEDYSAMLGPAEPSLGFSDLWSPTPQPATHPAMATSTILSADPSPAMFLVNDLDHPMPLYAPFEGDVHLSHMSLPPHRAPNADAMSSSHSSQSTHSTSPETRDMALSPIQSRMGLKSQKAKVSLPRVAQSGEGAQGSGAP